MPKSNVSGVILDIDQEQFIEWNLPTVRTERRVFYGDVEIENRSDKYGEVAFIGDLHIGHESHSHNPFNAYLNFLKERKHIQIGLMGDYVEYQTMTNYVNAEVLSIDEQIELFIRKMRPFKDRIVFILWGNHEERVAKYTKSNRFLQDVVNEIGVDENCYVGKPERGVYTLFKAGENEYGTYSHHSSTGAIINKTIQLRRAGSQTMAALVLQGHTHHLGYEQRTFHEMTSMGRVTRRQWLISTGSFIKGAGYAEKKSYPMTQVGAPIIRFYADRGKVDFVDLSVDYRDYLEKGGEYYEMDRGAVNMKLEESPVVKSVLSPDSGDALLVGRKPTIYP